MAVSFKRLTLNFDTTTGGEQVEKATAVFGSKVNRAQAALNGFDVQYDNTDRELKRLKIDVDNSPVINGNTVEVTARYLLRDNSGNIDDPYSGRIDVLVIADVA
jgi:hypothetical protein